MMQEYFENGLLTELQWAENLAMSLRERAAHQIRLQNLSRDALPSHLKVSVEYTEEGWLLVKLPVMLPRRKDGDSARLLMGPMHDAFRAFQKEEERKVGYPVCVIVYEHIYDRKTRRRFIDHDNLELKHCQDVIEAYFLVNDSSSMCSAFQCSHRGEEEGTNIWILEPAQFPVWLDKHRECWDHTGDLTESCR